MSLFVQQNGTLTDYAPASHETGSSWSILSPIELSIKRKIESVGKPLKDWDIKIYRGILTGCNEAFIIDGAKREEILNKCRSAAERERTDALIRPILRGRDIKRYKAEWAGLYVLNVHNGIKEKNIPPIKIEEYPAIKAHLDLYWDKIAKRSDKGDTPYNLRNCVYMEDFLKQKIVWAEMTNAPKFVLDNDCMFIDNIEYFLTGDNLEYIVCILNSKLYTWLFDKICAKVMGARKWRKQYVEVLPIPKPDCKTLFTFNDLYKTRTESTDLIIEDTIAQMLHLTSQEKLYIRSLALQGFD